MTPTTVVFDIGNVLIGWDPRNLYRKLFDSRRGEMEWFLLTNVCNHGGTSSRIAAAASPTPSRSSCASTPEPLHPLIRAYDERWHEMLSGEITGTVEIVENAGGWPKAALTRSPTGTRTNFARRARSTRYLIASRASWSRAKSACSSPTPRSSTA